MKRDPKSKAAGPFQVGQVRPGDRYELSRGHAIYCAPTGGSGARGAVAGIEVLDTDPAVESSGMDAGFSLDDGTLRAPDLAIGNVPDAPGWIKGVPPLAVEYAGTGQDENDLQDKIVELLGAGTRWVWVVRLVGPRRVEVYERTQDMRVVGPGQQLVAPGVLKNPVPVEALFDRSVAHEATLRNLLERKGYGNLDEVRQEGRTEGERAGRAEGERAGLLQAIETACELLAIPITGERHTLLAGYDVPALRAVLDKLRTERRWP